MLKQVLVASVFSTSMLLAGAAMAQTRVPPMHSGSGWHYPRRAAHWYPEALNTLHAHGFHGVHHLRLRDGDAAATAVAPNGRMRRVTVYPATHQVQLGVG